MGSSQITSWDDTLYHGTTASRLKGILKKGALIPAAATEQGTHHRTKSLNAIFMTEEIEAALWYSTGDGVIFEIDASSLPLEPDYDDTGEQIEAEIAGYKLLWKRPVSLGDVLSDREARDVEGDAEYGESTPILSVGESPNGDPVLHVRPMVFFGLSDDLRECPEVIDDCSSLTYQDGVPGFMSTQFRCQCEIPMSLVKAIWISRKTARKLGIRAKPKETKSVTDYENPKIVVDDDGQCDLDKSGFPEVHLLAFTPKQLARKFAVEIGSQRSGGAKVRWGAEGAGILFFADNYSKVLLLLRSASVAEPFTWGIPGGAVGAAVGAAAWVTQDQPRAYLDDEELYTGALREAYEEITQVPGDLVPFGKDVFKSEAFRYTTFMVHAPDEFTVYLNWENSDYGWFPVDELPEPLHPGVAWLVARHPELFKQRRLFKNPERVRPMVQLPAVLFRAGGERGSWGDEPLTWYSDDMAYADEYGETPASAFRGRRMRLLDARSVVTRWARPRADWMALLGLPVDHALDPDEDLHVWELPELGRLLKDAGYDGVVWREYGSSGFPADAYGVFVPLRPLSPRRALKRRLRLSPNPMVELGHGVAQRTGFLPEDADPRELAMGVQTEMQHIADPDAAMLIALDHLAEIPDYYTRLLRMQKQARRQS